MNKAQENFHDYRCPCIHHGPLEPGLVRQSKEGPQSFSLHTPSSQPRHVCGQWTAVLQQTHFQTVFVFISTSHGIHVTVCAAMLVRFVFYFVPVYHAFLRECYVFVGSGRREMTAWEAKHSIGRNTVFDEIV